MQQPDQRANPGQNGTSKPAKRVFNSCKLQRQDGRMAVSTRENYAQQGAPHVAKDEKVGWKTIEEAKAEIANHCKAITNMFRMGEDWGESGEFRVRRAMHEVSTIIPHISCTAKDHKPIPESGVPQTRPLCNASCTINQRVSDVLSDVLSYMYQADCDGDEVQAT